MAGPPPPPTNVPAVARTRRRRWPWVLLALFALLALGLASAYAWLGSEAALRYAVRQASERTGGALVLENVHGSLLSTVTAGTIRYQREGTSVTAEAVELAWSPRALLARTVRFTAVHLAHVDVRLTKKDDEPPQIPDSIALPFAVVVDRATVDAIDITSGASHWTISGLGFAYTGGPAGHSLRDLALTSEAGSLSGHLDVAASKPFALRGVLALTGTEALHRPVLDVTIGGNLDAIDLAATGTAAEATLRADARLTPLEKVALRTFAIDVRNLDLRALAPSLPLTKLDVSIKGTGAENFVFTGEASAHNGLPGTIDAGRVPIVALASRYTLTPEAIVLAGLDARIGGGGRITGSGTLALEDPAAAQSAWSLELRDVNARSIYGTLIATALSGKVRADVTKGRQHVVADVRERGLALAFDATIAGTRVDAARFQARAGDGELSGSGQFDWSGPQRFTVAAVAKRLDPARFGDFPQALIDARLDASGALKPSPVATGRLAIAPTTQVRGAVVRGTVEGTFGRDRARDVVADLALAGTALKARGSFGASGDRLDLAVDSPDLAALAPLAALAGQTWPKGLAGAVQAQGHLDGDLAALGFGVDARVRRLAFDGTSVASGEVHAAVPAAAGASASAWRNRRLTANATATGLTVAALRYDRAAVDFKGSLGDHAATLSLAGEDVDAKAEVRGGFTPAAFAGTGPLGWSGTLVSMANAGPYPARLLAPAHIEASAARVLVEGARIAIADGTVRIGSFAWAEGRITSRGDFASVPVAAAARLARVALPLRTTLVVDGDWDVAATPRLNGTVHLRRQSGDVFVGSTEALEAGEIALGVRELAFEATLQEDAIRANGSLRATRLGNIAASVALGRVEGAPPGRIPGTAPIDATITGELASLAPFQPFLGTAAVVDGALALDVRVTGTVASPNATGAVIARNVRIDAPKYGINWHDGTGEARLGQGNITLRNVSFVAGDGRFTVEGSAPLSTLRTPPGASPAGPRLSWHADHFRATNRPDLRLVISGDGTVGMVEGKLALRGAVRLDEGRIDFERTPGATLSSDVVVVGRPQASAKTTFEDLPLGLDLQVDLGERLRITGEGLRATLQGKIRVSTGPGGVLRASGILTTVDGTYLAFGQQLTIERGRLIFDGPVDNPALDIVALRKNLAVEAGVAITGTARLPQVQLTSNPPVPEGEKLSWLVLGQGLERNSGADLAALQAAAGALFGGRGPSLGTRIAERIGLDDLSLRTSPGAAGSPGTQVLAVSKRLTNRLYLVFEQGLSLASNALRLEYLLTRSLTVRAQAGSNVSSLGVHFLRSFQ